MNFVVLDYEGRDAVLLAPVPDEYAERLRYEESEVRRRCIQVPDYQLMSVEFLPEACVGDTTYHRTLSFTISPLAVAGSDRLAGWIATAADEFTGNRVRALARDEYATYALGSHLAGTAAYLLRESYMRRSRDVERAHEARLRTLGLPERLRG